MGSCIGSFLGSCVGSAAITACCACCSCRCIASSGTANLVYVLTIVISAVAAVSLRYGSVDLNIGAVVGTQGASVCTALDSNSTACDGAAISFSICNGDHCKGYWAVYRIAFVLTGYHLLLLLGTVCRGRTAAILHHGCWLPKLFFLAAVAAGTLFAPNDLFAYYAWIARFIAPLFLVYQLIVYIDFGYTLNATLVAKDDRQDLFFGCSNESGNLYKATNLAMAVVVLAASLCALGVMYAVFPMGCAFNPLAITTTLLFGLGNTALSISPVAEHGSLLCSALIFAYTTWLCYATLAAFPDVDCNPLHSEQAHTGALVASCVVAAFSLGYIAYRTGSKEIGANAMSGGLSKAPTIEMGGGASGGAGAGGGGGAGAAGGGVGGGSAPRPDEVTVHVHGEASAEGVRRTGFEDLPIALSYWGYHFKMTLICLYMAMLLTDWGVPASTAARTYSVGYASAWLQMSMNWVCALLYCWTLIAPKACPGRSFD